jgi:hypothetical protein
MREGPGLETEIEEGPPAGGFDRDGVGDSQLPVRHVRRRDRQGRRHEVRVDTRRRLTALDKDWISGRERELVIVKFARVAEPRGVGIEGDLG